METFREMRNRIFVVVLAAVMLVPVYGATVTVNGVKYTTRGNTEVSCCIADSRDKGLAELEVVEQVLIDGLPYSVTSVEGRGFKGAKYVKSVKLPNSVKRIGMNAFEGCENLESIVLPDQARVDIPVENYGFGGNGPFKGCIKLREVRGNRLEYPAYALTMAFRKCPEVPFAAEIPFLEASNPDEVLLAAASAISSAPVAAPDGTKPQAKEVPECEVDRNIPRSATESRNRFAVIVGNEDYRNGVAGVEFAAKDARVFADYCHRTLGLPESNIRRYENATYGDMLGALKDITAITEAYGGDVDIMFYYAGHGIPDERDRSAYLMPVDADGSMTEVCFPLAKLYERLGGLGARSVVVFLDACFSGSQRGEGMLMAARGVKIKSASVRPKGNMVVFSAASGDQTAYPYKEKGHGIFTYYLLEKLQETKGDVTLGDLYEHLSTNVAQQSVVVNRKIQLPAVSASLQLSDQWESMKLK